MQSLRLIPDRIAYTARAPMRRRPASPTSPLPSAEPAETTSLSGPSLATRISSGCASRPARPTSCRRRPPAAALCTKLLGSFARPTPSPCPGPEPAEASMRPCRRSRSLTRDPHARVGAQPAQALRQTAQHFARPHRPEQGLRDPLVDHSFGRREPPPRTAAPAHRQRLPDSIGREHPRDHYHAEVFRQPRSPRKVGSLSGHDITSAAEVERTGISRAPRVYSVAPNP